MGQVTKVLLLLAVVVPVTAYVAGSLASPGAPPPADHSPVILRDAPTTEPAPTTDTTASPSRRPSPRTPAPKPDGQRGGDEARVVTPKPTPVGEDDDEWDDDGSDDDEWDDDETDDDGDD